MQSFLILKWSQKMSPDINKLKFNKEEFHNLNTRKIATIHEFSENKLVL